MANGDPRLEKIFAQFIAPCCWRENLSAHHSPTADELRAQIIGMIAAGPSDGEIRSGIVEQDSIRILSLPDGARGKWLGWTPWLVALGGLFAVVAVIRRSLPPDSMRTAG